MKICLDAGHYGKYNQGIVKSYYESEVMWKLTNYQKQYLLEYQNVSVILTRSDINKDKAVYDRGYAAKGCNLFISNHSNAATTESTDYPVVIRSYDNKNNSDKLALQLANKITSLMATRQSGRTWTRKGSNGEYYGVLRGARAAGLSHYYIIEHSFHTNKKAATWLLNEDNIKKLAKAEVEVIAAYYGLKKKATTTPDASQGSTSTSYIVKINTNTLNVRKGPSTKYAIATQVNKGEAYTIVETKDNWGKLKSGIGWISLKYTKR